MPRSSGTYTPPAGNPVVSGTVISTAWANGTVNDIGNELTNSIPRDGTAPPTANIPMGNFKLTGVGAATLATDVPQYQQIQSGASLYLTAVAGINTITASLTSPTLAAYAAGNTFRFVAAGANTGAVTLNINGLGAKAITKNGATSLVSGDIPASAAVEVIYDGTQFQIVNAATSNITDASITNAKLAFDGGAFSYRNRLINPRGNIYQRTVAATADDTYFADRWYALTQTGTVLPSRLTDPENKYPTGVRLTQSQAVAQRFGFAQIIEGINCKDLRSESGTLVPRIRVSNSQAIRYAILGWTGTEDVVTSDVVLDWTSASYTAGGFFLASNLTVLGVGSQTPTANTWTSLTALTASLGTAFNNIIIMVWTEGTAAQNFTFDFDYVQLEQGTTFTAFENRNIGVEDFLCRRYLPVISSDVAVSSLGLGICTNAATAAGFITLPIKVPPRRNPSGITVTVALSNYGVQTGNTLATTVNSITFVNGGPDFCKISVTWSGGAIAANQPIELFTGAVTAGILLTGVEL
jgi:hypothetical protein